MGFATNRPSVPNAASAFDADRKQPNSRMCFVCGLENPVGLRISFYDDGTGSVRAEYTVPAHFQGYPGRAHGGIVAAMLDEIVGRVVLAENPNHFMATAKLDIRYRLPIPLAEPLQLSGWLARRNGRLAWAHAEVRLPDGSLGAAAAATLVDVGPGVGDPKNLGWRVYPDAEPETKGI